MQTIDAQQLNTEFIARTPEELISWAGETFQERLKLACSVSIEDVALVHLISIHAPKTKVFVLDTGRLHQETYDTLDRLRRTYNLEFQVYFPRSESVQNLVNLKGFDSFKDSVENRKECCFIRKVEPLQRALQDADAWITGLRRSQSTTRIELPVAETDESNRGILKLNPLASWSEEQTQKFVDDNKIPFNPLQLKGFRSIGCVPCTRAIAPTDDVRAGRWWWESPEHKECGLHSRP